MKYLRLIPVAIAIGFGLIILGGYFLPDLNSFRVVLVDWAVIVAAMALLLGVINLGVVHLRKVIQFESSWVYSIFLLITALLTAMIGLVQGPYEVLPLWVFDSIQVPLETSLMALVAVSLVYASVRMLNRRANLLSIIFVVTVLIVLVSEASFLGSNSLLSDIRDWIVQIPAAAGARGILLGVALGIIATGLRILLGADRPYGG